MNTMLCMCHLAGRHFHSISELLHRNISCSIQWPEKLRTIAQIMGIWKLLEDKMF